MEWQRLEFAGGVIVAAAAALDLEPLPEPRQ